jgi:hypothetical protein
MKKLTEKLTKKLSKSLRKKWSNRLQKNDQIFMKKIDRKVYEKSFWIVAVNGTPSFFFFISFIFHFHMLQCILKTNKYFK